MSISVVQIALVLQRQFVMSVFAMAGAGSGLAARRQFDQCQTWTRACRTGQETRWISRRISLIVSGIRASER